MSKYGLQLRVKPQQQPTPLGFNDEDDDNVERDIMRQAYTNKTLRFQSSSTEEQHKKALEEDSSEQIRPKEQDRQDRKPRYMQALIDKTKQREREHAIIYERKLAKERDQDEHLYADKDKFVTSAYKKKLAEQAKWMEEERLRELREKKEDMLTRGNLKSSTQKWWSRKPRQFSPTVTGTSSVSSRMGKSHQNEIPEDPSPKENSKLPYTMSTIHSSAQNEVTNEESASNRDSTTKKEVRMHYPHQRTIRKDVRMQLLQQENDFWHERKPRYNEVVCQD